MIEPRETLKNIEPYGVEPYAQPCVMKLDANENYLGPSPRVMKRLENISVREIAQYPRYGELISVLAAKFDVLPQNLLLTNGADEALDAIIRTFLSSEEALITVSPTINMPRIYTAAAGAEYREIEYSKKWEFPQEEFLQAIDEKVKIILFTTPNDPTGGIVPAEFIEKTAKLHPEKLIVIVESFAVYAGQSYAEIFTRYDNIAVVRSFSKDYGLAGLRIGCIISGRANISAIKKVLCPYTVNSAAVIAAKEAICDEKYLQFLKEENEKAKNFLKEEFTRIGGVVYPSYTNFLLVDFKENAENVYQKLAQKGIRVKKYAKGKLKNHLRITIPSLNAAKNLVNVLSPENLFIFDLEGVIADNCRAQNGREEELLVFPETLNRLNGEKVLYSGLTREKTGRLLEKYGLKDAFSGIVAANDPDSDSKNPEMSAILQIKSRIFAKNVYYLGDTPEDMKCAKKAGVIPIGVLAPKDKSDGQKDLLYVFGAQFVLHDINQLPDALKTIKQEQI